MSVCRVHIVCLCVVCAGVARVCVSVHIGTGDEINHRRRLPARHLSICATTRNHHCTHDAGFHCTVPPFQSAPVWTTFFSFRQWLYGCGVDRNSTFRSLLLSVFCGGINRQRTGAAGKAWSSGGGIYPRLSRKVGNRFSVYDQEGEHTVTTAPVR